MPAPNLDRICISSWSFHTLFEQTGQPMEALDFPRMVAERYHLRNIEMVFPHLSSTDPAYLENFKYHLQQAGSRLVNIPVDYRELWEKPSLSSTDSVERERAIFLYQQGIDVAAELGSPFVRCDPGIVNLDDPSLTVASYRRLAEYGHSKGVGIIVENHGSISRHPEVLVKILESSGAGALPDIGNFPDEATRERGLRLLFPWAKGVSHAKLDDRFDLKKYLNLARDSGFDGIFSIEATGTEDPYLAVQRILDVLVESL